MNKLVKLSELVQSDASSPGTPIVADREALLILRESYFRVRLFEDLLNQLRLSSSLLEEKLCRLVEDGMLRRVASQGQSEHGEYVLTSRGFNFLPTALSILRLYGEDDRTGRQRGEGTVFDGIMICGDCGEVVACEIARPFNRAGQKMRDQVFACGPFDCDVLDA
jgi:DNA-binding HxlR family transcriptional regulator